MVGKTSEGFEPRVKKEELRRVETMMIYMDCHE